MRPSVSCDPDCRTPIPDARALHRHRTAAAADTLAAADNLALDLRKLGEAEHQP